MGSTGSIGTQTLEVIASAPESLRVGVLSAHSNVDLLVRQAELCTPDLVVIVDETLASDLQRRVPQGVQVEAGLDALGAAAAEADVTINCVVGFAGLGVTLATLSAGKRLGLANKESLIAAGPIVQPLRLVPGAELIPVDSEHCAIHQCLRSGSSGPGGSRLSSVVLTASGGPFRGRDAEWCASVTLEQALAHPTWSMGPKITVDSSTLMNKGLEVIEAHELFGVGYDSIEVVVHPESIVHSMATFTDGSTIAQLSQPDMRLPIGYALSWPNRHQIPFGSMDFSKPFALHFEPPDLDTFRCLSLAFAAGRAGETAPAWLSASNEVAVEAFLEGRIGWLDIAAVNDATLQDWDGSVADSVDAVLAADSTARRIAATHISQLEPR